MTKNPKFLKSALDAIDRRDPEAIEGLRGPQVDLHVDELLATWRRSLPWDAKDLYVHLFMDQKDGRLETLMRDALDSPTVETRAPAICYLTGNFALATSFLAAGGWVDPARVDAAIAKWRNEVGATTTRACKGCGAPHRENDLVCYYCRSSLRPEAEDPGLFSAGGAEYELRVGVPAASNAPHGLVLQNALKPGPVGVRLTARARPFLDGTLRVRILVRTGPVMVEVASEGLPVRHGERVAYITFRLTRPAEYEVEITAAEHRLGTASFRIVH